jgi:hypothetical protein
VVNHGERPFLRTLRCGRIAERRVCVLRSVSRFRHSARLRRGLSGPQQLGCSRGSWPIASRTVAARSWRPVASSTACMVDSGSTGIGRPLSTTGSTRSKPGVVLTTRPSEPTASTPTRISSSTPSTTARTRRGTHLTTIPGCLIHHDDVLKPVNQLSDGYFGEDIDISGVYWQPMQGKRGAPAHGPLPVPDSGELLKRPTPCRNWAIHAASIGSAPYGADPVDDDLRVDRR